MSRSDYTDDCDDPLAYGRWMGRLTSALRGKRGQAMLRELLTALDAMQEKRLIVNELVNEEGNVCALGALYQKRGVDMKEFDSGDVEAMAKDFDVSEVLIRDVVYTNDEYYDAATPEERWLKMRAWVAANIHETPVTV